MYLSVASLWPTAPAKQVAFHCASRTQPNCCTSAVQSMCHQVFQRTSTSWAWGPYASASCRRASGTWLARAHWSWRKACCPRSCTTSATQTCLFQLNPGRPQRRSVYTLAATLHASVVVDVINLVAVSCTLSSVHSPRRSCASLSSQLAGYGDVHGHSRPSTL